MLKSPISLLFGLFSLLAVTVGYGQKAFITVIDQKSHEPVSFAHVCFEGMKSGSPKYSLTSIEGTVANEVKEISKIVVSYMGYATYSGTINPGESAEIQLFPKVLNMDEVVVTAQYTPERADKSIYKVNVINSRQIEQKAATNMADLLKDQLTMRVTQDGVLGTSLRIQGMSGENVKFLQDGVPLIGRMNGNFDLNQINLFNVDHIEIIEGPMSVIYGSNALAGVINIITKENKSSLLNATVDAYVESAGVYNFDGSLSFNHKKHGMSIDGGRNFSAGNSQAITTDVADQRFKPRRQYFMDGYYTFSTNILKLKATGEYFNEVLLDKGLLIYPYYETAIDNHYTTTRYSGKIDAVIKLPKNHFINALASWTGYTRISEAVFLDYTTLTNTVIPEASDTAAINNLIARGTFAKSNPDKKFNYQAGADISYETGTGKKIAGNKQEIGDYAAFLSMKYDPVPSLSIQPGFRFIYNTKYKAPVVYALSAKWAILSPLSLRFSYARGFRAPAIKELYMLFVDVNHNVRGNPDLQAEKSHNFSINLNYAVEQRKIAWSIDLNGFYNLVDNVILLAQTGNTLEYRYENISRYKSAGFQFGCTYQLYPAFKIQAGFGETGITGSPDAAIGYDPFKWSPEVTLSSSYRFMKQDITLSLYYKYTGSTPQLVPDQKQLKWGWTDSYNIMDITASKGFWDSRIRLSAGVKNIFNTTTIPTTGGGGGVHSGGDGSVSIGYGRTVFAKISFQFNKYK